MPWEPCPGQNSRQKNPRQNKQTTKQTTNRQQTDDKQATNGRQTEPSNTAKSLILRTTNRQTADDKQTTTRQQPDNNPTTTQQQTRSTRTGPPSCTCRSSPGTHRQFHSLSAGEPSPSRIFPKVHRNRLPAHPSPLPLSVLLANLPPLHKMSPQNASTKCLHECPRSWIKF